MKRNMDLIRDLLIFIEDTITSGNQLFDGYIEIEGYTQDEILYHYHLLKDYNFVVYGSENMGGEVSFSRLTAKGHDFLDNIRNEYIWDEIKNNVAEKGVATASLDIIKDFANKFIRKKMDLE